MRFVYSHRWKGLTPPLCPRMAWYQKGRCLCHRSWNLTVLSYHFPFTSYDQLFGYCEVVASGIIPSHPKFTQHSPTVNSVSQPIFLMRKSWLFLAMILQASRPNLPHQLYLCHQLPQHPQMLYFLNRHLLCTYMRNLATHNLTYPLPQVP